LDQTGPDITVPPGFSVGVRLSLENAGSPIGYVGAASESPLAAGTRERVTKGEVTPYFVSNMNQIAVNSNTAGAIFEFFSEI
jgi:hypothetical protein